jgi:hypothetical protein
MVRMRFLPTTRGDILRSKGVAGRFRNSGVWTASALSSS